jgi:hypothetical protein
MKHADDDTKLDPLDMHLEHTYQPLPLFRHNRCAAPT